MLEGSHDNVALCVGFSALAGLAQGFFSCVLSWANREKVRNGYEHTRRSRCIATVGALGSIVFGFGSLVGLRFGPISLVTVVRAGALLPSNAVFSQVFGLRPLGRDDYLGTLITICGVVCFSIFAGPPSALMGTDEYLEKVSTPEAITFMALMLSILVVSLGVLAAFSHGWNICLGLGRVGQTIAVSVVGACSSAFMDLSAKGWSSALSFGAEQTLESPLFWATLSTNTVFLVGMRGSMIYGCKSCDVLLFVPLNTVLNIVLSCFTGLVVLEEWRQVESWPGLSASAVSIITGVIVLAAGPPRSEPAEARSAEEEEPSQQSLEGPFRCLFRWLVATKSQAIENVKGEAEICVAVPVNLCRHHPSAESTESSCDSKPSSDEDL